MQQENEYIIQGFRFTTKEAYEKAKKEQESIAYIKANTDLTKLKTMVQLYDQLAKKQAYETIIGQVFLDELRQNILKANIVTEEQLEPIVVKPLIKEKVMYTQKTGSNHLAETREEKYKRKYEQAKTGRIKARITIGFLVAVLVAMFVITKTSNHANLEKLETELLNKYSSWKVELDQKEAQLNEREAALNSIK